VTRFDTAIGRMKNTPGLLRDLALVIALLFTGSAATVYLFAHYHVNLPWESKYSFSADFDQAPAIQLSSVQEVRIAGVSVGKITGAKPDQNGTARLTFSIDPKYKVYRNATMVLQSKTPLNVMYFTLNPGTASAGPLPENATLPVSQTQRVTAPYELLDELDPRARAALTSLVDEADVALANASTTLPPGLTSADSAITSFQPVLTALTQRKAQLRQLVTSISQIATAAGNNDTQLAQLVNALQTTLYVVSKNGTSLSTALQQLPGVTSTLRTSMASAASLTDELTPALRNLSAAAHALPNTLDHLTNTVNNVRTLATKAGPVVAKLRPVLADLRPLSGNLRPAIADLTPVIANLPQATARLVPWLDDLGAFVYNTSSSFSLGDANGGLGRANVVVKVNNPTGGGL
jgi:phospholipid/cholesterol/gamma-HCH transport system substrate-binding protein